MDTSLKIPRTDLPANNANNPRPINFLANGVAIQGHMRFANDLVIDGQIEGEITGEGMLTVGSNAQVHGEIKTRSVIVHGLVHGNITVEDRCELRGRAQLTGDLKAARLVMDEGATFVGKLEVVTDKTRLDNLRSEYDDASKRGTTPKAPDSPE